MGIVDAEGHPVVLSIEVAAEVVNAGTRRYQQVCA
jgi:hypothetical protein